jgi:hypothetical protein
MEINHKFEFVNGTFDTDTGKIVCVPYKKYETVELCFKTDSFNIPFAIIKLHSKDRYLDAKDVFDDAVKLGKEIEKRWNNYKK